MLFFEFIYELTKKANKPKKNIYNELFNDYKKKEIKINKLKNKYNKSEEKMCTFSPRINYKKIKFKKKISKKENNKSYLYRSNNCLYDIGDINYKYETIDNDINNNIILNFVNKSRINNITKKNLFNIKFLNNKKADKNYFLLNTPRNNENIKYKTIENNKNNINNKYLLRELSSDKYNRKSKTYYLIKKGNNFNKKDNKEIINYSEPIMSKISDNKYNTINILEKDNKRINFDNAFNKPVLDNINKTNSEIELNNITNTYRKKDISIIYNSSHKKNKTNEDLKQKEYYYSFRKDKIPYYNSFNNSSKKKTKNVIPYNNCKKSTKIKKNKIPISLRDNSKFRNFNKINQIYSINYNNKINRIQKYEQDFNSNNNSFSHRNIKITKNKLSFLDMTSKKESTRQQSNTNINTNNNDTKGQSLSSLSLNNPKKDIYIKEFTYSSNNSYKKNTKENYFYCYPENKKEESKQYEIVNECNMNLAKRKGYKNIRSEKSMTLQSLSDSKIMELAEHYINNGDDSFEVLDLKYLELKKNMKKEKARRDITFG